MQMKHKAVSAETAGEVRRGLNTVFFSLIFNKHMQDDQSLDEFLKSLNAISEIFTGRN